MTTNWISNLCFIGGQAPAVPRYFSLKRGSKHYLVLEIGKPRQCAMVELQQSPISSAG
jgi:hypothetical protein